MNERNEAIGRAEKMEAHRSPMLHRAFSVMLFNEKGETLLQQRAASKYHSPSKWTNACCSHPEPGEKTIDAAQRRLQEELGINSKIEERFSFLYQFHDEETGLHEHEHDTVFEGKFNGVFKLNPIEVSAVRWISLIDLEKEISEQPGEFTFWFRIIWEHYSAKKHIDV